MFNEKDMQDHNNKVDEFYKDLVKEAGFFKLPTKEDFKNFKKQKQKVLALPIDKQFIDDCTTDIFVEFFKNIEVTKDYFKQSVFLTISGYDNDMRELYEIKEVVAWVRKFLLDCPQALYYINNDASWSFMKGCIAKDIKVLRKTGKDMLPKEVAYRQSVGLPITQIQLQLTVEEHVLNNISSQIKRLGSKIGDLKGAVLIAHSFVDGFVKE